MSFIKRLGNDNSLLYKPLYSLKGWNDPFFWVDAFACPASFPWHTSKSVSKDPFPKSSEFNAEHYATSQRVEMDLFSFIRTVDPTKVRIGERQRAEASVDKLFDEGGSGNQTEQGDSAVGGQGADIQLVSEDVDTVVEDVASLQPRRQRKRKTVVVDVGEPSHPTKKLREDHETPGGASVAGKSMFVISSDSSYHYGVNVAEAEFDSLVKSSALMVATATIVTSTVDPSVVAKKKPVEPSIFWCCGIRTVIGPDTDLQKFFTSIRGMEHDQLFTEFNVGAARQMSLSAKVRMCAEYNIKENKRLKSVVNEQTELLKVGEIEIENLKAQLLLKEAEAAKAIRLRAEASKLEAVEKSLQDEVADLAALVKVREQEVADLDALVTSVKSQNDNLVGQVHGLETSSARLQEKVTVYVNCMGQLERFQDERMKVVNDKFDKLEAISKAIEKGMQDGLAAGITHGQEGRVLTDVAAYNPSAEVDYVSALQQLQNVNFSLLAELKSNMDASVKTLMNILRLEEVLAKRLGLNESQPHVDQLMVPIHHSPDQTVIGATELSLAFDVSSSRVRKIKDNIANHRSAIRDVFIQLAEPFSTAVLMGAEGASNTVPSIVGATTALSITFASTSLIAPISTDDYEIVRADGQEGTGTDGQTVTDGNADPFPNVDDAELSIQ
ncbi:hypothetical protein Tco_0813209 [Tanacetum coccineum]